MPRLQKIALYYIAVVVTATAAAALLYQLFGEESGIMGLMLLVAAVPGPWIFRAENGVKLDEMERAIALRSLNTGLLLLFLIAAVAVAPIPALCGRSTMMPAWYLGLLPFAGAYVLLLTASMAMLWFAGTGEGGALKLAGLIVCGIVLVAPVFAGGAALLRAGDGLYGGWYGVYAGSYEADEWHATASGSVEAHSRISLSRWPGELGEPSTPPMRIKLPYDNAEVTAATFEGQAVEFRRLGGAAYELKLPGVRQSPFDFMVDVTWTMPLKTLWGRGNPNWAPEYRAELKSLIPTYSFVLKTVADPGSGFRSTAYPSENSTYPFTETRGQGSLETERGSCSLCVAPENGVAANQPEK